MALESQRKHTFRQLDINKDSVSVETELIKGEKRVGEHLSLTHDSVEIENNNKEVPKYQLVTRS